MADKTRAVNDRSRSGPVTLVPTPRAVSHGVMTWLDHVRADPRPWLLADENPAVQAATRQRLLHQPADAPDVRRARAAAMDTDPTKTILAAQHPHWWGVQPGPGYAPK